MCHAYLMIDHKGHALAHYVIPQLLVQEELRIDAQGSGQQAQQGGKGVGCGASGGSGAHVLLCSALLGGGCRNPS